MAFTFTKVQYDPGAKVAIYTATTDTSSAASTLSLGFVPITVDVYDSTNANIFHWNDGMADGSYWKTITNGTTTYTGTNGITPVSGTSGAQGVTLGTGLHTNSTTYSIVLRG